MGGRISSLVVSLALSFCLWLSLAGQDTSIVDMPVTLELFALSDNLVLRGDIPKEVTLRLRANTAQLRFLADRKLSLPLDLSLAREGRNAFKVLLEPLNLPRGVQVSEVSPSQIEFEALRLDAKTVPLEPKVVGQPAPGFRLGGVALEPETITLHGPREILDKLDRLDTAPIVVDGLTRDTALTVNVLPPEGVTEIIIPATEGIRATVTIEEVRIQADFSDIPIEIEVKQGNQAQASFVAKPARVRVTVSWPASRSRPVNAREILARISIDGEQLKAEGQITLPVVVVPPNGATVTAINPVQARISYVPSRSGAADGPPRENQ
ncbi:hypothetical protein FACS189460_2720 [Deltaproteobacteria bacterium]|nr:hypothetical protein FACS189460_2720 [Deltaproteobacteria bacterium]